MNYTYTKEMLDKIDLNPLEKIYYTIDSAGRLDEHFILFGLVLLILYMFLYDRLMTKIMTKIFGEDDGAIFWIDGTSYTRREHLITISAVLLIPLAIYYTYSPMHDFIFPHTNKIKSELKKMYIKEHPKPKEVKKKILSDQFKYQEVTKKELEKMEKEFKKHKTLKLATRIYEVYKNGNSYIFKDRDKADKIAKEIELYMCPKNYYKKTKKVCSAKRIEKNKEYFLNNRNADGLRNIFYNFKYNEKAFILIAVGKPCEAASELYSDYNFFHENYKEKKRADQIAKQYKCIDLYNRNN